MAKIAYQDKRKSQKSLIAISIFAFFLVSADTSVPLGCCLPKALIKAATLEYSSSNLVGTCSVWFLRHQWAKKKPPCGGSFSLGALRLSRCGTRDRHRPCHSQT